MENASTRWDYTPNDCFRYHTDLVQTVLFRAVGAINIITDLVLIILPCLVLWGVQVSTSKRVRIIGMLSIRFAYVFFLKTEKQQRKQLMSFQRSCCCRIPNSLLQYPY
jgi:hypothetical protein